MRLNLLCLCSSRTPAMIGCSFVVDREYFGQIGLLDPGMEVYGGENIELGMRVGSLRLPLPLLVLMDLITALVIHCVVTSLLQLGTSRTCSCDLGGLGQEIGGTFEGRGAMCEHT